MNIVPNEPVCDVCHKRRHVSEIFFGGAVSRDSATLHVMSRICKVCAGFRQESSEGTQRNTPND